VSFPAIDSQFSLDIELNLWVNLMSMLLGYGLSDLTREIIFDIKVTVIPNDS